LGSNKPEEIANALAQIPKAMEDARQSIIDNLEDNKPSARDAAIQSFDKVFQLLDLIPFLGNHVFESATEVDRLTALAIAGVYPNPTEPVTGSVDSPESKNTEGSENSEQEMITTILASYKRAKILFSNMEKTLDKRDPFPHQLKR
jgi:hypothetical protein